jgi:MFS family permease
VSAAEPERRRRPHGFQAFRHPAFALYWIARVTAQLAMEMQIAAVGWQVYRLTGDALALGLIGLAQFAPFIVLFLVTGLVADRLRRERILAFCVALQAAGAAAFFLMSQSGAAAFGPMMAILVLFGIARAFQSPVVAAMIPNLVPAERIGNGIAWASTGNQISRIVGPAIAGVLIAVGAERGVDEVFVYGIVTALLGVSLVLTLFIRTRTQTFTKDKVSFDTLVAGLRFIWTRQVVFAAIALDLFAVLFGGATALLPIFAKDILEVGSEGFGVLRSAFMVGAFLGALILTQRPVVRAAGTKLLVSAGVFGAAVILFGVSTSFALSFLALFVMGAADVVSVFIRHNLVQLVTPDDMRGRVGAVNGVFVGASNELGEFRAGLMAHWIGAVAAVALGGAMTLAVVLAFARFSPAIRRVGSLEPAVLIREFRPPHDRHGRPHAPALDPARPRS